MPTVWIENKDDQEEIIEKCDSCAMAMVDTDGKPYVVMMNFGYHDGYLYLHGDPQGKKMDILHKNPQICITMSTGHGIYKQNEEVACSYGMNYKSIVADGRIEFVDDYNQKVDALNIIMKQYVDRDFKYNEPAVKQVCIFKVKLTNLKAKNFGRFVR
ncbi:MAG: pyridoxamine 5'-phosphate oxidase family protein [Salinivirgaceae bacterium]|jgi:nitroimidazol reductase NimA-like FMN-containing flavoprotein (pyridoxamine 5'-phosphate oxidase superfamily)|nr:pyridoxamine 5'-phosphate oxidase family protein [Salinivirgaceae bacterium]